MGDSLSDNGNDYKATNGSIPSDAVYHSKGRFTNGLVWVEYLAEELGKVPVTDIAWGGSRVNGGLPVPPLAEQEQLLRSQFPNPQLLRAFLSDKLVTITEGSNDIDQAIYEFSLNGNATALEAAPIATLTGTLAVLSQLIADGARNILLWNLPPLDLTTLMTLRGPAVAALAKKLVTSYNLLLAGAVKQLSHTHPSVYLTLLDVNADMRYWVSHPASQGFTNVTAPCLAYDYAVSYSYAPFFKVIGECTDPRHYFIYDALHPTTFVHKLLSDKALAALGK
jgi:phospholipase/lecithinase/hemolysin